MKEIVKINKLRKLGKIKLKFTFNLEITINPTTSNMIIPISTMSFSPPISIKTKD